MTAVIPTAPSDLYSRSVQEKGPATPLVFACSDCSFEQAGHGAAITRHLRLHAQGVKKHQVPSGEIDVDGFAVELTELADSRS